VAWDEGLVGPQREAASYGGTHARLLAGPGTGKTLTLTRRVVKLVTEDNIAPGSILLLTFTRVNAYDLLNSISDEFDRYGMPLPRVSTLHSYALRQLLRNRALITTLPQPLRIADDYEEKEIIYPDIARILGLTTKEVGRKFDELSADWQSLAPDEPSYRPADPRFMGEWQTHRSIYGYTLRSELVWQLKTALEENPAFDLEGAEHFLVDEYQDLNKCDLAIIRALAERGAEVFCTGDDDQSIYGFRRAHPAGIRNFLNEYQPSIGLELDICFRSWQTIIDVGQYVANLDSSRLEKPLRPWDDSEPGEVRLLHFPDQNREAWAVARICKYLIEVEGFETKDILVLLRSDHQRRYSSVLQRALESVGLEVSVRSEKGGPMDEPPGRYLLCLMSLAVNDHDDLAWRTLLHLLRKGNQIGTKTILAIYSLAVPDRLRFHQALFRICGEPTLIRRGGYVVAELDAIRDLCAPLVVLQQSMSAASGMTGDQLLGATHTTARETLLADLEDFAVDVIVSESDLRPVLAHIRKIAERSKATTLSELLAALRGPEDTFEQELDEGKINILTMHRAKGLTARAVIIVGAEEQLIPGDAVGEDYHDQRRLLYVSLTRAGQRLYVTYCNNRYGRQRFSGSERESGNSRRTLTPFLRGAIRPEPGMRYVRNLRVWHLI